MMARKLDKSQWRTFFDRLSKTLEGKQAEIEVTSLSLGDQVEASGCPCTALLTIRMTTLSRSRSRGLIT